jgi:hypothetical protein
MMKTRMRVPDPLPEPGFDLSEVSAILGYRRQKAYELKEKGLKTYVSPYDGRMKVSRLALAMFIEERAGK